MVKYPKPNIEELPELYDDLDELIREAESALRDHFNIKKEKDNGEKVIFADASKEDFLEALWEDSEVMVPFFQKIAGLPDREFERLYGYSNIGSLRDRKTDFRGEEKAVTFAEALEELLPDELYLETPLYTFIKMWENDQRRHRRAEYEDEVRTFLKKQGYSAFKGNKLPGEPDVVIPESPPYEVIGEVRVIQPRDYQKRFKEFGSEARSARINFSDIKFIAIANLPLHDVRNRREKLRESIHKASAADIDAVIFQDELDKLVELLKKWDI